MKSALVELNFIGQMSNKRHITLFLYRLLSLFCFKEYKI